MCNRQFFEVIPEARDAFFDRELSKTLGQMVKALKKNTIEIPSTLEERLTEALKIRNGLAHGYFYKRSAAILSLQGRENMISELQERVDFFQALDNDFTEIMVEWMNCLGVSKEDIDKEMRKFLQDRNGDEDFGEHTSPRIVMLHEEDDK